MQGVHEVTVSEITGIGASCSVEKSGQSQYETSYQRGDYSTPGGVHSV